MRDSDPKQNRIGRIIKIEYVHGSSKEYQIRSLSASRRCRIQSDRFLDELQPDDAQVMIIQYAVTEIGSPAMKSALTTAICLISCVMFWAQAVAQPATKSDTTVRVALIQFDAVPEQVEHNLKQMERLARDAAARGARWIMFHEGSLCDYTGKLDTLAEAVPDGPSTQSLIKLSAELNVLISFGLSEQDGPRFYITQVFVKDGRMIHRYRKTWLHLSKNDEGFRNEWARYDPGTGPELFEIDGIRASCFICADGNSFRCRERIRELRPQIVFYPNNRRALPDFPAFGEYAQQMAAPMLVTNRIGTSWVTPCSGGCVVFGPDGTVLAKANRDGQEEILIYDLNL